MKSSVFQIITHFKGFEDSLIFVGNIPNLDHIRKETAGLSLPCAQLIWRTHEIISKSAYGRLPYDALEEAYQSLSPKMKTAVTHFRGDIAQNILINRWAWMLGKREVRIRILRLAVQQRQVVILSGHTEKTFAHAAELGRDIGQSRFPVKFINTEHVVLTNSAVFIIGGLHLRQPIRNPLGRILFACLKRRPAAPLLSDYKPNLRIVSSPDQEILCYQNDQDFR